jgi:hypothetical protein
MVCFQTKNPNLDQIFPLPWKMMVYFMDTWSILRCFDIFETFCIVRVNLVYFSPFGILYQEKSGNPEGDQMSL